VKSRIILRLEGDVQGLAESRLSLTEFGKPLRLLVIALRRVGSDLARSGSRQNRPAGRSTGRYAALAAGLDLELVSLEPGSVGLELECTFRLPDGLDDDLFVEQFKHEAADRLVRSIDDEAAGRNGGDVIRRFLRSMPESVRQEYRVLRGKDEVRRAVVDRPRFTTPDVQPPFLRKLTGNIVGVRFAPPKVCIGTGFGECWAESTEQQMERALAVRADGIIALVVSDSARTRLLWLRRAEDLAPNPTPDERMRAIFSKWDSLLRRLAE
jgi:hypothetical protein